MKRLINPLSKRWETRLTRKQADLLLHILLSELSTPDEESLDRPSGFAVWRPNKYLGRKPTSAESSTLSNRLRVLFTKGHIDRDGRMVRVSGWGRYALKLAGEQGKIPEDRHVGVLIDYLEAGEYSDVINEANNIALTIGAKREELAGLESLQERVEDRYAQAQKALRSKLNLEHKI